MLNSNDFKYCEEKNGCACGENGKTCSTGQYCTRLQYHCASEPGEKNRKCDTKDGCACGNATQICKQGEYCNVEDIDEHCVGASEFNIERENWTCGQCQNNC